MSDRLDDRLREWATPTQARYMDAINLHGGGRTAAKALGMDHSQIFAAIRRLKKAAALHGYSPDHDMTRSVPDGFLLKGVSTYYDRDGKAVGQWVKSTADSERQAELFKSACEAMAEELPRLAAIPKPLTTLPDLCNLFTFTDSHVGMLAWRKEGGDDWDLGIAERTLIG